MISTADFRKGLTIELDGEVFSIIDFQHVKPGKGGAFVRTKLRNVRTGNVFDRTFRAGERMERALLERKQMQFLYAQDDDYVFMDTETYDQVTLAARDLGDATKWLKDNLEVSILTHEGRLMGVELPDSVEFRVTQTDPAFKGDTVSGTKPATIETGAVVQVPFFIEEGDTIRVDTRSGLYLERVST